MRTLSIQRAVGLGRGVRLSGSSLSGPMLSGLILSCLLAIPCQAADVVDLGTSVPEVTAITEGLFPEDLCKEAESNGYKCMGFKPAVRFALPTASFKLGSAELPELLRLQLDKFAEVLKGKRGSGRVIRIEGHADATGNEVINRTISQKRADAVRDYLVKGGADAAMLEPVGMGAKLPKVVSDPYAAENRRVELARAKAP